MTSLEQAREVIRWCRQLAKLSEDRNAITRTFLSKPMRDVHTALAAVDGARRHDGARGCHRQHSRRVPAAAFALTSCRGRRASTSARISTRFRTPAHSTACSAPCSPSRSSSCSTRNGFHSPSRSSDFPTRKACGSALRFSAAARSPAHSTPALLDRLDEEGARCATRSRQFRPRSQPDSRRAGAGQRPRLSRVPHRAGARSREPQPSPRCCRCHFRSKPGRIDVRRRRRARRDDADEDAEGRARRARPRGLPKSSARPSRHPDLWQRWERIAVEPGAGNVVPGRAVLSLDVRHPADRMREGGCGAAVESGGERSRPAAE